MTIETWLAFTTATVILIVIPGPTILLVVSYALGQGWRTALPMAAGVALGECFACGGGQGGGAEIEGFAHGAVGIGVP